MGTCPSRDHDCHCHCDCSSGDLLGCLGHSTGDHGEGMVTGSNFDRLHCNGRRVHHDCWEEVGRDSSHVLECVVLAWRDHSLI